MSTVMTATETADEMHTNKFNTLRKIPLSNFCNIMTRGSGKRSYLLVCFGIVEQAAQCQPSQDGNSLSDKSNVTNLFIMALVKG